MKYDKNIYNITWFIVYHHFHESRRKLFSLDKCWPNIFY